MKIGFVGAGKMGFTLGRHINDFLKTNTLKNDFSSTVVEGYFSSNPSSAKEAAMFTNTKAFDNLEDLVKLCDIIFITVPDGQIAIIANELDRMGSLIEGKILCHTSGACSSHIFSGMDNHVYGYSIHPIYAVNSKTESYINFQSCYITIEGHEKYLDYFVGLFEALGHSVKVIEAENKVKYHCAAVFASNLVIGLYQMASDLLMECGFDETEAANALKPLFENNVNKLMTDGSENALTGPVERFDIETVNNHQRVIEGEYLTTYQAVSRRLAVIALSKKLSGCTDEYKAIQIFEKYNELVSNLGGNDEEDSFDIC